MESPDSGMASGRWRRSSLTDRVIRLCGTFASASACAVRSTIRSWKEKRQALRGPRAGETNPAAINARIVLRGRRSNFSTSRTPYWCMTPPPCELELGIPHVGFRNLQVLDRPHLAGVQELLHDEPVVDRADHHDVLLAAGGPAPQRAALRLAQPAREQRERLGSALVGCEVVR